ncbi:hypothetical protein M2131_001257 [Polynucleobacter sphagniphilus]|jgi:hypothetical protein|uniref:hypothetical protein n=1 Tax=Polynucleobacter sphagniphilus TaxID=1743169 RepID=UPI002475D236|nr:hypothetical protein [Polynucleobacter sphagniphilus]MDH6421316.1 hypothetical protein [Polynucleobacter sphagniphilus]
MKTFELVVESQVKGTYLIQAKTKNEAQEMLFNSLHRQFHKVDVWDFDMRLIAIHEAN